MIIYQLNKHGVYSGWPPEGKHVSCSRVLLQSKASFPTELLLYKHYLLQLGRQATHTSIQPLLVNSQPYCPHYLRLPNIHSLQICLLKSCEALEAETN